MKKAFGIDDNDKKGKITKKGKAQEDEENTEEENNNTPLLDNESFGAGAGTVKEVNRSDYGLELENNYYMDLL